jgi:hypothetical protein
MPNMKPRVEVDEAGRTQVKLGVVLTSVLATIAVGVITTVGGWLTLPGTVRANEKASKINALGVETCKKNDKIIARNLRYVDENVRQAMQTADHTALKVNKLLHAAGITERIPEPDLKKSELEELD